MQKNNLSLFCELIYIPSQAAPLLFSCLWTEGLTVGRLLQSSGFEQAYPAVKDFAVGIFSRHVTLDTLVKPGDRVELYRPLLFDPKEKRRRKAKSKP